MNILYLSHRIPYPPNKGDKIRSFNQIKYLARAGHNIHLFSLVDQAGDMEYKHDLLSLCETVHLEYRTQTEAKLCSLPWLVSSLPLSVPCFYSPILQKEVDRLLREKEIEAVFCFSSVMGEYIIRSSCQNLQKIPLIMDFCDLDSDKWLQYSTSTKPPMSWIYSREGRRLLEYENRLSTFFDYSLFVTEAEASLFRDRTGSEERVRVLPNGVDHEFFSPSGLSAEEAAPNENGPTLMFSGAMDYYANIEGITWFCKAAWPGLSRKVPELQLYVVGANPTPAVRKLAGHNVVVTGFAPDIRDYYRKADICIIPLRLARGVQNKVLEAMAMGKPVVTTSKVLQGIPAAPGDELLTADSPQEFEDQILRLLNDPELAHRLGKKGREFVLRHYDWQENLSELDKLLKNKSGIRSGDWKRGLLNPVYFLLFVLLMLLLSAWPMSSSTPGAVLFFAIKPGLQNFMHFPVFTLFSLLLLDFLEYFDLSRGQRLAVFAGVGTFFCLFLEGLHLFVPGRYFSFYDILINMVGIATGLLLYKLFLRRKGSLSGKLKESH